MVKIYMVGGAVRDILMKRRPNDFDFTVEADSYDDMKVWLEKNDFEIFLETPLYYTIRARSRRAFYFAGINLSGKTFDFVLARKDGAYSDGRRPDTVEMGTILDDLARRDFTMNAIAMSEDGALIDPFYGQVDIENELIRCVGGTERLEEDPLRLVRAIRFQVTLKFMLDKDIYWFIHNSSMGTTGRLMEKVAQDRIRDELTKALSYDTHGTVNVLASYDKISRYIFDYTDIWLLPTSKKR